MSNTKNIFEFLSDDESGDEGKQQNKEKRVRTRGKKAAPAPAQQAQEAPERSRKQIDTKHKKEYKKNTGPSTRNRSKDRQSGTGISGVRRGNYRKDGAGQGNVGTVKDEITGRTVNNREEVEEQSEEEEEAADNTITVEQYFQQKGSNLEKAFETKQQEKAKAIDQSILKKDKLELVQTKPAKENFVTGSTKAAQAYKPGYAGEGADLLSFRTGFVADPKRKKRPVQQEGEATTTTTTTEVKEGEEKTAESPKEEGEKKQRGGPRKNNNRGGDNRGPKNNNRGVDNRKDNRGPRGGKGFQTDNTEDFPTLG